MSTIREFWYVVFNIGDRDPDEGLGKNNEPLGEVSMATRVQELANADDDEEKLQHVGFNVYDDDEVSSLVFPICSTIFTPLR